MSAVSGGGVCIGVCGGSAAAGSLEHSLACLNLEPEPSSIAFSDASLTTCIAQLGGVSVAAGDPAVGGSSTSLVRGLRAIRKMTCADRNPPLQQVVESGVVPRIVSLLSSSDPVVQFESAWVLTNIASGTQKHARAIAPALPRLASLLQSKYADLQEQAIWALGNYAGSSCAMRDAVLELGVLPQLLSLMSPTQKLPILRVSSWAVSNLTRGKPAVDISIARACLPVMSEVLSHTRDEAVLIDGLWSVSFITDDTTPTSERLDCAAQLDGFVPLLVTFLRSSVFAIQSAALRCIGNLAAGTDAHTQSLLDADALSSLLALLVSSKKSLRKEACWAISNISAGNARHVDAIVDANLLPAIITILENETFNIQKEAAWCISNLTTNGTPAHLALLTRPPLDAVPPLMELLTCADATDTVSQVVLVAVQNLLRAGRDRDRTTTCTTGGGGGSSTSGQARRKHVNPVLAQVHSAGGPAVFDGLRRDPARNADHPVARLAREILDEFFPATTTKTNKMTIATTTKPKPKTGATPPERT